MIGLTIWPVLMSMLVVDGSSGQEEVLERWDPLFMESLESLLWSLARLAAVGLLLPVDVLGPAWGCSCPTGAGWDDFDQSLQSCCKWKENVLFTLFSLWKESVAWKRTGGDSSLFVWNLDVYTHLFSLLPPFCMSETLRPSPLTITLKRPSFLWKSITNAWILKAEEKSQWIQKFTFSKRTASAFQVDLPSGLWKTPQWIEKLHTEGQNSANSCGYHSLPLHFYCYCLFGQCYLRKSKEALSGVEW